MRGCAVGGPVVDHDDLVGHDVCRASDASATSSSARPFHVGMTTETLTACRARARSGTPARAASVRRIENAARTATGDPSANRPVHTVPPYTVKTPCSARNAGAGWCLRTSTRAPGPPTRFSAANTSPVRGCPSARCSATHGCGSPWRARYAPSSQRSSSSAVSSAGKVRHQPPARPQHPHHLAQRRLALLLPQVLEHLDAQHGSNDASVERQRRRAPTRPSRATTSTAPPSARTPDPPPSPGTPGTPSPRPTPSRPRAPHPRPPALAEQPQHRLVAQRGVEVAGAQPEAGRRDIGHGAAQS